LNEPLALTDPNGLIWGYQDFEQDGHAYRRFVWFDGKKVAKGFTAFTPAKDGTVIALKGGDAARIYRNGTYDSLPGPARINFDNGNLNASAGAFDGGVPFGRQIRNALGLTGGIDENSSEYKNSSAVSAGVVIGTSMLDGAGEVKLSEEVVGLGKQLASDSQLADVMSGDGKAIMGAGTGRALNDAQSLAKEYGGSASDWAKVSSSAYKAKDGSIIEVHAYQNIRTGQVVEAKSVSSSFPGRQ